MAEQRQFDEQSMRRIARTVLRSERARTPSNLMRRRSAPSFSDAASRFIVKALFNDYLQCKVWDGVTEGEEYVFIAKPRELRHDVDIYEGLTTLTTVISETVTASDGDTEEEWRVTPAYKLDGEIWATPAIRGTGVTADIDGTDTALLWIDDNRSGRAWAQEPEE